MAGLMDALDAFGRGLAYNSDEAKEDRKDQRELDNYEKKLRLASKVEEEVMSRKRELAKQYPEIAKTINTPFGVTLGVYTDNSVKELYKDNEYRDAIVAGKQGQANLADARAEAEPVKADAAAERAAAARAAAEAAKARVGASNQPKPITPVQTANFRAKAEKSAIAKMPGRNPDRKMKAWQELPDEQRKQLINQELEFWGVGGEASPAAPTANSNPFLEE